jgi:hypothetical protein
VISSPFHFRLPVTTKLSFNDAGRITHHRDVWDMADLLAMLPGMPFAQWVGTRMTAHALSFVRRAGGLVLSPFSRSAFQGAPTDVETGDKAQSTSTTPAQAYTRGAFQ